MLQRRTKIVEIPRGKDHTGRNHRIGQGLWLRFVHPNEQLSQLDVTKLRDPEARDRPVSIKGIRIRDLIST